MNRGKNPPRDARCDTRRDARRALDLVRHQLLAHRTPAGHWEGHLSCSALSTATAISAMSAMLSQVSAEEQCRLTNLIQRGFQFLQREQNDDGGWGDTDRSHSNIATSYLVLAASTLARETLDEKPVGKPVGGGLEPESESRLRDYIKNAGGMAGLRQRYGTDQTFVVPILCNLAIAGLVDWHEVPSLPFEAAALPQSWYRLARMPVVSYAVPALVAMGQAKHGHQPSRILPLRWLRNLLIKRTLNVLQRMQPLSGGYLEATPLTAFVMMGLASIGRGDHAVCHRGMAFLESSIRPKGGWPIDTNLATWVTSSSIQALASDPQDDGSWHSETLTQWLLSCQHQIRHPFTGADPGGWGWTDLSGAVPDGDDTPAAILALRAIRRHSSRHSDSDSPQEIQDAILRGQSWLQGLQNRNGGVPTFCRGWGKLPFDRSSTDLTAHAIRAWASEGRSSRTFRRASQRAQRFLIRSQRTDGSWLPLWFGNQDQPDDENPLYGTAKAMLAPTDSASTSDQSAWQGAVSRAAEFLLSQQNADGGWGGGPSVASHYPDQSRIRHDGHGYRIVSTVEETALAVESLVRTTCQQDLDDQPLQAVRDAISRGVSFLVQSVDQKLIEFPSPIGFYFAKLWYHEQLYPLIFTASALGHFLAAVDTNGSHAKMGEETKFGDRTEKTLTTTPPR